LAADEAQGGMEDGTAGDRAPGTDWETFQVDGLLSILFRRI